MTLLVRVMQIVFELASCAFRDGHYNEESKGSLDDNVMPSTLSLATPTSNILPDRALYVNTCNVFIKSMLLRAEYGGMKCDTQMLHSYTRTWLMRFQSGLVPNTLLENLASVSTSQPIYWCDIPRLLHETARERSVQLVTTDIIRAGGLPKLNLSDICLAGIDFHCSSVVDYLMSQREIRSAFHTFFAQMEVGNRNDDKIAETLKRMIWNFSSGINHRRPLFTTEIADVTNPTFRALWNDVVKVSFDAYTTKFVKDRLV
jgi:non-ribosomal peptide synthetase component F